MPPSVPHLSPPGPGGHWALTSQWGFCSSTNSSLHGPVPCVGWRTWPCPRAPGVSVCPRRLCFPLYPDGTPGPPESPGTRWSRGSPRGPESPAQPRWWVWGGSLEGNQRQAHQVSPPTQASALSPDLPDTASVSPELPSPCRRPGGDPCRQGRRELGPGTDSPACTWVLRPTLSPGRERPVRGMPSALSSASPPREPRGPGVP